MKTPIWVYIVGITMIVFASCGVVKNLQSVKLSENVEAKLIEANDLMIDHDLDNQEMDSLFEDSNLPERMIYGAVGLTFLVIERMISVSKYEQTWIVRFGYLGLFITMVYLLAGVFLLMMKSFSIKLAYEALICNLVFASIKTIVLFKGWSGSLYVVMLILNDLFDVFVSLVLIIVIMASNIAPKKRPKPNRGTGTGNMPSPSDTLVVD
jgi:hypothetical protein